MGVDPIKILPNESSAAYQAFLAYQKAGPTRTILKTVKATSQAKTSCERWSRRFNWVERVKKHEEKIELDLQKQQHQAATKRGVNWAVRAQKLKEQEWEVANKLMDGGKKLLERLLDKQERKLTGSDVARLLEVASKLGRLSAGMATEQQAVAVASQNNAVGVDFNAALSKVYGGDKSGVEVSLRTSTGQSGERVCKQVNADGGKGVDEGVSGGGSGGSEIIDVEVEE